MSYGLTVHLRVLAAARGNRQMTTVQRRREGSEYPTEQLQIFVSYLLTVLLVYTETIGRFPFSRTFYKTNDPDLTKKL